MKQRSGPPRLHLASSRTEAMPEAHSHLRLLSLLETLEECREVLTNEGNEEAGRLLSLAILELRMEVHNVTDSELKALCELMVPEDLPAQASKILRLPPYLKLIK